MKSSIAVVLLAIGVVTLGLSNCGSEPYPAPLFDPPGGTYTKPIQVTMTSTTPGALIRYTTDGTDPIPDDSIEQPEYHEPVLIGEGSTTLKAFAWSHGRDHSEIVEATYVVTRVYSTDWVSVAAGGAHARREVGRHAVGGGREFRRPSWGRHLRIDE